MITANTKFVLLLFLHCPRLGCDLRWCHIWLRGSERSGEVGGTAWKRLSSEYVIFIIYKNLKMCTNKHLSCDLNMKFHHPIVSVWWSPYLASVKTVVKGTIRIDLNLRKIHQNGFCITLYKEYLQGPHELCGREWWLNGGWMGGW